MTDEEQTIRASFIIRPMGGEQTEPVMLVKGQDPHILITPSEGDEEFVVDATGIDSQIAAQVLIILGEMLRDMELSSNEGG